MSSENILTEYKYRCSIILWYCKIY